MINGRLLFSLFTVFLPFIYLATIYGGLPAEIPIHFDWRGQPDGWGPKIVLWVLPFTGLFLSFVIMAAFRKIGAGDPGGQKQQVMGMITLTFISLMLCYIIYGAKQGALNGLGGLAVLLGLFFAALGNYLPVIPKNYFIGIRIPPTLKSDYKWRKTHRYAGPWFMGGGLLMVLAGLLLRGGAVTVVMLVIVTVISLVPIVYAYQLNEEPPSDFV
ncbi:MAG: SdpI family protein [Bacteroidota bacterium]